MKPTYDYDGPIGLLQYIPEYITCDAQTFSNAGCCSVIDGYGGATLPPVSWVQQLVHSFTIKLNNYIPTGDSDRPDQKYLLLNLFDIGIQLTSHPVQD